MQNKSTVIRGSVLTLALMLGLAGCEQGKGGQPAHKVPVVGVITVKTQAVTMDTKLAGRTSAYAVAEIRPQVDGIILKRRFVEGGDVKAGQALYQIDPATYLAANASAKAALAKARANLTSAKRKADRYQKLIGINAVGQQDYDDVVAAWKSAEADVSAAVADADKARINLAYSHVNSPITGRIGKSSVTRGALVTANQTQALTTVQQLDPIYVDVTRSSNELLQLRSELASGLLKRAGANAAKVRLVLEDGSDYPLAGRLEFSDVTVDPSTGSVGLRAVFPNPRHQLLPGMYVQARLVDGIDEQAIMLPQNAVGHNAKGQAYVMVVGVGNKAETRLVHTVRAINNQWLINQGLKAGEQVIVDGLQYVRPGVLVKPEPAKAVEAGE